MADSLHICLVSNQLQPNVIPWLELKPKRALLLASKQFDAEAQQLQKIAGKLQIQAHIHTPPIPSANYTALREYFLELATTLPSNTAICINLTGGTKLMALAAADVLAGEGYRFIYTDTHNRQIEYLNLNGDKDTPDAHPFTQSLNIAQLMACGMAQINNKGTRDLQRQLRQQLIDRAAFTEQFARAALENKNAISTLNWQIGKDILSSDGRTLKKATLPLDKQQEHALGNVLNEATRHGLIDFSPINATLHFRNTTEARWLHGIWLEEYVWLQMRAAGLKQFDTSVELEWLLPEHKAKQLPANELDAIAAHDNRLCIVECKTGKLEKTGKQDVFHKLSRLSFQLAGPFGHTLLVSLHAPRADIADRAKHSGVTLIHGQQLLQLKKTFVEWMART